MTVKSSHKTSKWIAILAGASIAVLALASWRVPANSPSFGAEVTVRAVASGALSTSQGDPFLIETDLDPGEAASGTTTVTNASGTSETFQTRAAFAASTFDQALQVQATIDGQPLYAGPLAGLGSWSSTRFTLAPGAKGQLATQIALPQDGGDYRDRLEEITLEFSP